MTANKRLIRISLISFFIFNSMLLLSCASGGLVAEKSKLNATGPDAATVTVMRQKTIVGAGVKTQIFLDNELIAYLGSGDYVRFNSKPGAHFVSFLSGGIENVVRFYAEPDEKYYFYLGLETMGGFERRTEKEAEDLIAEDDYTNVGSDD